MDKTKLDAAWAAWEAARDAAAQDAWEKAAATAWAAWEAARDEAARDEAAKGAP